MPQNLNNNGLAEGRTRCPNCLWEIDTDQLCNCENCGEVICKRKGCSIETDYGWFCDTSGPDRQGDSECYEKYMELVKAELKMRLIRFRGKRKDNDKWTYGYLFGSWEQTYILWGTTNGIPDMTEVIPETVGQYTEKNDKNGKEVYDGDKIKCLMNINTSGQKRYRTVTVESGCPCHVYPDGILVIDGVYQAEIIGNIH